MCVICVRFATASARHAKFTWDPSCGDWWQAPGDKRRAPGDRVYWGRAGRRVDRGYWGRAGRRVDRGYWSRKAGGSIGGIGVGRAGGPAAGEHQQNENINGVAGKPPVVMTKRQSFDFRPLPVWQYLDCLCVQLGAWPTPACRHRAAPHQLLP